MLMLLLLVSIHVTWLLLLMLLCVWCWLILLLLLLWCGGSPLIHVRVIRLIWYKNICGNRQLWWHKSVLHFSYRLWRRTSCSGTSCIAMGSIKNKIMKCMTSLLLVQRHSGWILWPSVCTCTWSWIRSAQLFVLTLWFEWCTAWHCGIGIGVGLKNYLRNICKKKPKYIYVYTYVF